ncbi:MAG: transposase [Emcibacter sp.]|nr:transposase [Emcibacter sp.]
MKNSIPIFAFTQLESKRSGNGLPPNDPVRLVMRLIYVLSKSVRDTSALYLTFLPKRFQGLRKLTLAERVRLSASDESSSYKRCVQFALKPRPESRRWAKPISLLIKKALYADAAYSSARNRDKFRRPGIKDYVQRKGYRGHPISEADKKRNAEIAVTRSCQNQESERPFATYKCRYGLGRTRFMGLAKNLTFYGLAAMASNIKKAAKFLMLYGLPDPAPTG